MKTVSASEYRRFVSDLNKSQRLLAKTQATLTKEAAKKTPNAEVMQHHTFMETFLTGHCTKLENTIKEVKV